MNASRNTGQMLIRICVVAGIILVVSREAQADFTFSEPINLESPVNTSYRDSGPSISADGLTLYFHSNRPGGQGWDIWFATRATTDDPWGEPVNLGAPVNTSHVDIISSLSADGLSLYFTSDRPGGYGDMDLWVTSRASTLEPWSEPVNLGSIVNSNAWDARPSISADGLSLYFGSNREKIGTAYSALEDVYVTTRSTINAPWSVPARLGPTINLGIWNDVSWPCISADGQILFFGSDRPGGMGGVDLWFSRQSTEDGEWSPAVNLGAPINTPYNDRRMSLSPDGRVMYFPSNRSGGVGDTDIWQATIDPIVDFDGNGIIDLTDMVMLIDNWENDNTLYDIGPLPWGDGVVDIKDLKVFIECWEEEQ